MVEGAFQFSMHHIVFQPLSPALSHKWERESRRCSAFSGRTLKLCWMGRLAKRGSLQLRHLLINHDIDSRCADPDRLAEALQIAALRHRGARFGNPGAYNDFVREGR